MMMHSIFRPKKSFLHRSLQTYFLEKLGKEELSLEHPFPEIKRIADLFWKKQNLVIEIQCSSISTVEIYQRVFSYQKLNLTTIWLLSEDLFFKNQKLLEGFYPFSYYFFSFDSVKKFKFFDPKEEINLIRQRKETHFPAFLLTKKSKDFLIKKKKKTPLNILKSYSFFIQKIYYHFFFLLLRQFRR